MMLEGIDPAAQQLIGQAMVLFGMAAVLFAKYIPVICIALMVIALEKVEIPFLKRMK